MREIVIDGAICDTPNDIYDAFFSAVGSPSWHGRNFNAVRDSIAVGRINRIETPYRILIKHYASIGSAAKSMAAEFVALIRELQESGYPVDIKVED